MFYYPQEVLKSATHGLNLWVNYVLPALLPFFIISEILMKQGFVQFLGIILEPLMRPLFGLPGKAAFVVAMTHTSGIPIGAVLTSKMRKTGELTKIEGERLLVFTSNPSPGFMFGAVASGMLGNPALGIIIAGSVYIANLIVGFIFRFYGRNTNSSPEKNFSLSKAWYELVETSRKRNNKPFGQILADAVRESVSTILLVGGFIVFFAVITHMLTVLQINTVLAKRISVLSFDLLSPSVSEALIQGLLETTLGCQAVVTAADSLTLQIGLIAFLLGWGGISVFAQVGSFTASTDLRFLPFILGRTLHAVLALIMSQILFLTAKIPTTTLPLINLITTEKTAVFLFSLRWSALYFVIIFSVLIFGGLAAHLWQKIMNPY
ncbi:MAG: sporulation integral membrane protein YlbJ [Peptococcaceae bacterium]|nr:sporulation integral membrane protein YlbJ [Peptococcaceae bacterium]